MNMIQMPKQPNIDSVLNELVGMSNILNSEAQKNILLATGAINSESEFTPNTYVEFLYKTLQNQLEQFDRPRICMFICPKLDATNMQEPSNLVPTELSVNSVNGQQADIFASRIPKLFQMMQIFLEADSPH